MVRPLRPDFEQTYHHVVIKGVNGLPIFDSSRKRDEFLRILRDTRSTHDLDLYAFGFLDNHWHAFVRRKGRRMARFFQTLKSRYTIWYNRTFERSGTLYGSRYFSSIVESEAYFQKVWYYVQTQGVTAGLYDRAEEDPGSTAGFYAGYRSQYDWIDWEEALRRLDLSGEAIGGKLQGWFQEQPPIKELPVRRERNQNFVASEKFVEQYMQQHKSEVREGTRSESPLSWDTLVEGLEELFDVHPGEVLRATKNRKINRLRAGLAYAARRYGHKTTGDIAERMDVSDTAVSRMIRKSRKKYPELREQWDRWVETGNRGV